MIASLLAYAAALAIAAAIPGPGVAALVGQSVGGGLRAAMCLLAGIVIGDLVYLTVAVAGLAAVAQQFAGIFLLIKTLGGLYLIWMAVRLWRSRPEATVTGAARDKSDLASFLTGFSVTLGNPKSIVFYLALLPTVLDLDRVGPAQFAALAGVTCLVLFATLTPYAALAARARGFLSQPSALARLNRAAAAIIGGAGALICGQALTTVLRRA